MRVAIIVKEFPPDSIGGLQTQTKQMASTIEESASDTDVVVFTKRYRAHDDSDLPYDIVRIPQLGFSPFISDLTFLAMCFFALVWHSRDIDCMQCMTVYPIGFLGLMVNRVTAIPYFAWIRGNDFYEMRDVWWKKLMIRRVLLDTRVLVQSKEIENDVRDFFSDLDPDIGILGNGVTIPDDSAPLNSDKVLFVGRLAPKKGVRYLITAMSSISSDAELWIVGDGDVKEELKTLAEELEEGISFYGEIDPSQVNQFYHQATVFVLPSTEGEGMPNAVLEAMAHGLPVVTTRSGGLPTVINDGETGYLVPMRDSDKLAKRIEHLLSNKDKREQVGQKGREYVRRERSWKALVEDLQTEYIDLQKPN